MLARRPPAVDPPVHCFTEDEFFDTKWAYWLRDTIPSAHEVVEITGGKLFFPHERAAELAPHVRRHWAAASET